MRKLFLNIFLLLIGIFICNITVNAYELGDSVYYNGNSYYVISDNGDSITLIKKQTLTKDEINKYGVGHINNRTKIKNPNPASDKIYEKEVIDYDGFANVAFYQGDGCGYDIEPINTDCKNSYEISDVKYIVDAWAKDNVNKKDLVKDETGLSVRLITLDELQNIFGYSYQNISVSNDEYSYIKGENTPYWIYEYSYWTMSPSNDSDSIYIVSNSGIVSNNGRLFSVTSENFTQIRPVITISKHSEKSNNKTYYIDSNSYKLSSENEYNIGDIIYYDDIKFIVINKSDKSDKYVTVLKDTPLTIDEVKKYGVGYINNGLSTEGVPKNIDGYGSVAYYSSLNCNESDDSLCTNNYDDSNIKHIVDNWARDNISNGLYISKIINGNDIVHALKYVKEVKSIAGSWFQIYYFPNIRSNVFIGDGWTSFSVDDSNSIIMASDKDSVISSIRIYDYNVIKPVIILEKTVDRDNNTIVDVPDTKLSRGIIIIISGMIIICLSVMFTIVFMTINKRNKKGNRQ